MRPGDRSAGNWSRNGFGTSGWNWGISWNQRPCASPSLLLPSRSRTRRLSCIQPNPLLPLDMVHPRRPPPGKRVASPELTFLFSPMEHCAVQQAARSLSRSGGKRLMGACGWCMQPAFATVVPVRCVSSANGMAAPPRSRARSAYSCIRSWLLQSPFFGRIGAEGTIDEPACICCTISGWIFRWHRAVCFPRPRRRQYFLGHGERIFGSRGQSA
jgi:hypothetical protein